MPDRPFPPANKRLGQHFLIDPNIVRKILTAAAVTSGDTVFEIGPGRGALTAALSKAARRVIAVEIDPLLHRLLQERQTEWPNVELVCADALAYPTDHFPMGTAVIANLPYYASTPLLFRLLDQRARWSRMVLMLQEEVVNRLIAGPGRPDYGVLSVMAQHVAEVTKEFYVSPHCFRPKPDVGSAVVSVRPKNLPERSVEEASRFGALVRGAFAHRRKTLVNSLRDEAYDQKSVTAALETLGISATARAENLSVAQFVALEARLSGSAPVHG
ncbi:MAG TPA: 16S rRNA (adenine(1518)-N(6)/adenine(1519)-N(6))-dimethyltransferase RsmA [Nitrospira sp.]|nr:16S rRNA (adenine(1518)-N(6)/adenine(1519)-N(6))-dimethyltransferase RsmA [Nitrospira sp.]